MLFFHGGPDRHVCRRDDIRKTVRPAGHLDVSDGTEERDGRRLPLGVRERNVARLQGEQHGAAEDS